MKYTTYTIAIFITIFSIASINAQCFDDGHSPFKEQGWLSCNTSVGPIPERGDAHWILYDFGHVYTLDSLYFWNHNVWGETGMGVRSILIDYSTDKENWTTVGPIEIQKAPGSWKYTGTHGPTLNNIDAQYALVTVLSTWEEDASCAGIAEIRFGVNQSVNVEEVEAELAWTLSPNPATDRISIQLPEAEIKSLKMFDSMGRLVKQLSTSNDRVEVLLDELNEGIYFVSISTEREVMTRSFVKVN